MKKETLHLIAGPFYIAAAAIYVVVVFGAAFIALVFLTFVFAVMFAVELLKDKLTKFLARATEAAKRFNREY